MSKGRTKQTKSDRTVLPAKHGTHAKQTSHRPSVEQPPSDIEDPFADDMEPEQLSWESEDERTLRDESEDPDAPRSL